MLASEKMEKYLVQIMIHFTSIRNEATFAKISRYNQNTAGIFLYKKLGFKPIGIEAREDPNGRQLALMHMYLQAAKTQPGDRDQTCFAIISNNFINKYLDSRPGF